MGRGKGRFSRGMGGALSQKYEGDDRLRGKDKCQRPQLEKKIYTKYFLLLRGGEVDLV